MPGAVSFALLLTVATLQLQSADAEQLSSVQAATASSLIQQVEEFVKVSDALGMETMYNILSNHKWPKLRLTERAMKYN